MITIKVTQEHINTGIVKNCKLCPVALALKDMFPTGVDFHAGAMVLNVLNKHGEMLLAANTPDSVWAFMMAFDKGVTVKPFEFQVINKLRG